MSVSLCLPPDILLCLSLTIYVHFWTTKYPGADTYIVDVLAKYNTRINPREIEVSSSAIFTEILNGTSISLEYLDVIKNDFYSFFRNDVKIYADAAETLQEIKSRNILIGTLSDVAYGMDNSYALEDIRACSESS